MGGRTTELRDSQNQDHTDRPITLSQFSRPLPSHQMFPSIVGRPHSSSHRARACRFLAKAHIEYISASIVDSYSFISCIFICSTVVMLSRMRRICVPSMVNVNTPNNPHLSSCEFLIIEFGSVMFHAQSYDDNLHDV